MNVRIQYDTEFLAGAYTESGLVLNNHRVALQITTVTENKIELNTAMERLKCFFDTVLANTVFIHQKHQDHARLMQLMGINVTTLPEDPIDQIIGIMLYCKLNAVMENRLVVNNVDISSQLSDGVWYQHDDEENLGPLAQPGWWNHPGILNHDIEIETGDQEKIVKVWPNSWAEYDLMWPDISSDTPGNIIVYANFGKNEDNSVW